MRRRQLLTGAGGFSAVLLAGCLWSDDTDSPRSVVKAYIEASNGGGDGEAVAALLHSESPLDPSGAESTGGSRDVEIDSIVVDEENLDQQRIATLNMRLEGDTPAILGGQSNALVDAIYEIEAPEGGATDISASSPTVENTYLTAKEDGDWFVVDFARR